MVMEKRKDIEDEVADALLDSQDVGLEVEIVPEGDPFVQEMMVLLEAEASLPAFSDNLAEFMDDTQLAVLASDLLEDVENDRTSRQDWVQSYVDGLDLLGMKIETRDYPWQGACGVYHPLLAEAVVKFQSEVMMATFPAQGPVRTVIVGKETPEKKQAAARVQEDMNYRLMVEMQEYRPEHERMLWGLGLSGNAFKKIYYDPQRERQVSMYVPAEDILVPYGVTSLDSSPRVTHVMRKTANELRRLQYSGFYRDVELDDPSDTLDEIEEKIARHQGFEAVNDARYRLLEIHTVLDLDGFEHTDEMGEPTGIAMPYVVTIDKSSGTVLSIRRNWNEGDPTYAARQHFVHYGYVPGFGFYHYGLVHLIGAFADSGTTLLRQLVDAGTLANLPGGFKARALRVLGDDTPAAPGEWRDVDVPAGTIKENILPLPYKEPSQTLMALMGTIIEEGRRFANTADLQISDMSAQAPVGTTLAILERTLKTMTAVQARVHYAMKQELGLLKDIIASFAPKDYEYEPDTASRHAKQADYADVDVVPVSDPNASTMAQRIVQYQAVLQLAQASPQLYNLPLLHRQMLEVLGIKNADKLVPMQEDMVPTDPVSENQHIVTGKPVKAFYHQDHQAHIMVHMAAAKDPSVAALMGENPAAKQMHAALMAHIAEHMGMQYRRSIELELGFELPPMVDAAGEETPMEPQVEARLAPLMAQAAARVAAKNAAMMAQQQAEQQAQDPLVQMQQAELAIKQGELQRKAMKDQMDAQARQQQQALEAARILAQNELQRQKLEAQNAYDAVKTAAGMRDAREKQMIQAGVDALKQVSSQTTQKEIAGARDTGVDQRA